MCATHECQRSLAVAYIIADGYQSPCEGISEAPFAEIVHEVKDASTLDGNFPYLLRI